MKRKYQMDNGLTKAQPKTGLRRMALILAAGFLLLGGPLLAHKIYLLHVPATRNACVILLHGLGRSSFSMQMVEHYLRTNGYAVVNIDYASTRQTIAEVANGIVAPKVAQCRRDGFERIHFVTHSMGAIVVRRYLQKVRLPEGSRIVMLAPPNGGSELADWALNTYPRFSRLVGPAGRQLVTNGHGLVSRLNPIDPEVGIITGNKSWNPCFSQILPGSDDGKVTVEKAKLKEMKDFLVLPCNHTTILLNREVQRQVVHFLESGNFSNRSSSRFRCQNR